MAKKVFAMYLAKEGNPNSDAYAKLDLPAIVPSLKIAPVSLSIFRILVPV